MLRQTGLLAAAAAICISAGAQADPLGEMQARSVRLGDVSGGIYYTAEPEGYRVVSTLQVGDGRSIVRFVATLKPGQSIVLSIPRAVGQPPLEVRVARHGDVLVVDDATGPTGRQTSEALEWDPGN